MLGTRVGAALDDVEKRLHGELTQLDRYVSEQHVAAGHRRLQREQHAWDGPRGGTQAALEAGVQALWELTQLLPDFKRKTLQVQYVVLFSSQMVAEAERKRLEGERRKAEAAAAAKAVGAAAEGAAAEGEVVVLDGADGAGAAPAAQHQQQQREQQGPQPSQSQQQQEEHQAAEELAAVLDAAQGGAPVVGSERWRGAVPGYAFKLGGSGLGYYKDAPPASEAFLTTTRLHGVAAVIGRALSDHQRRLARSAGPEAALFAALPLDAVEAKLESVKQAVALARVLREQHVAERSAALKAALQEDLDADLAAAATTPPLPASAGSSEHPCWWLGACMAVQC